MPAADHLSTLRSRHLREAMKPESVALLRETINAVERMSLPPFPTLKTSSGRTLPLSSGCLSNSDLTILHQKVRSRPRKYHFPC